MEPENLLNIAAEAAKGREQSCIAFLAPSQSQQISSFLASFMYAAKNKNYFSEKKETDIRRLFSPRLSHSVSHSHTCLLLSLVNKMSCEQSEIFCLHLQISSSYGT